MADVKRYRKVSKTTTRCKLEGSKLAALVLVLIALQALTSGIFMSRSTATTTMPTTDTATEHHDPGASSKFHLNTHDRQRIKKAGAKKQQMKDDETKDESRRQTRYDTDNPNAYNKSHKRREKKQRRRQHSQSEEEEPSSRMITTKPVAAKKSRAEGDLIWQAVLPDRRTAIGKAPLATSKNTTQKKASVQRHAVLKPKSGKIIPRNLDEPDNSSRKTELVSSPSGAKNSTDMMTIHDPFANQTGKLERPTVRGDDPKTGSKTQQSAKGDAVIVPRVEKEDNRTLQKGNLAGTPNNLSIAPKIGVSVRNKTSPAATTPKASRTTPLLNVSKGVQKTMPNPDTSATGSRAEGHYPLSQQKSAITQQHVRNASTTGSGPTNGSSITSVDVFKTTISNRSETPISASKVNTKGQPNSATKLMTPVWNVSKAVQKARPIPGTSVTGSRVEAQHPFSQQQNGISQHIRNTSIPESGSKHNASISAVERPSAFKTTIPNRTETPISTSKANTTGQSHSGTKLKLQTIKESDPSRAENDMTIERRPSVDASTAKATSNHNIGNNTKPLVRLTVANLTKQLKNSHEGITAAGSKVTSPNAPILILHIGPPKTGTTSLQYMLNEYRSHLLKDSYHLIGNSTAFNNRFTRCLTKIERAKGQDVECWTSLTDTLEAHRLSNENVILSNEVISFHGRREFPWKVMNEAFLKWSNVKVVVSYRHLHNYIPSSHFEVMKNQRWPSEIEHGKYVMPFTKFWRESYNRTTGLVGPMPTPASTVKLWSTLYNITVLDIENTEQISEFVCRILPNAVNTCQFHRKNKNFTIPELNKKDDGQLNYDSLTLVAWQRDMLKKDQTRKYLRVMVKKFQEESLNLKPNEFEFQDCLTKDEEEDLFSESVRHMIETGLRVDEEMRIRVRANFERAKAKKKFCTINATEVMDNGQHWKSYFQGAKTFW